MSFDDLWKRRQRAITARLWKPCQYYPKGGGSIATRTLISKTTEPAGQYSQVTIDTYSAEFSRDEVEPATGDTFEQDGITYRLAEKQDDDGAVITYRVEPQ